MSSVLVVGYGNPDRQDDGVAWHILNTIAARSGSQVLIDLTEGAFQDGSLRDLLFVSQITPELAESLSRYDYACFVDAHTGSLPQDVLIEEIHGDYQRSPFTHHMTPQTCLYLAQVMYGHVPSAQLVSVRGYEFGFSLELSERTALFAGQATEAIMLWLENIDSNNDNLPTPR